VLYLRQQEIPAARLMQLKINSTVGTSAKYFDLQRMRLWGGIGNSLSYPTHYFSPRFTLASNEQGQS
jgi:hypothetical protein